MHYKKNLKDTNDLPDWRYWNVFEEYMASRPNATESDFMADDSQGKCCIFSLHQSAVFLVNVK